MATTVAMVLFSFNFLCINPYTHISVCKYKLDEFKSNLLIANFTTT